MMKTSPYFSHNKPVVWLNGVRTEESYHMVRVPIYPKTRLKRLWWKLRGIQPTEFTELLEFDHAPDKGAHVVVMYETTNL